MSRRYNATRFDEENVNGQCYRCNIMFDGEQYKHGIAIDNKYGVGTAAKLHDVAQLSHPFTTEELQEIIDNSNAAIAFYLKEC